MFERIALGVALALSLLANVQQWRSGQQRYQDGRAAERQAWVSVVEDRNRQIEMLSGDLSQKFDAAEFVRNAALAEAAGGALPILPPEIIAACSLPTAVRTPLNRIARGS